jgi:predicted transcriptional regulator
MSPRAACRLEQLGFADVYDYVPGKTDWMAAGLPREGESVHVPYAGDLVIPDVPRCGYRQPLKEAEKAMREHAFCVAVTDDNVVLGMLYARDREHHDPNATVEQAMHGGPTTVRANEPVQPLVERMRAAAVDGILVTDPEGRLLGLLDRHHGEHTLSGTNGHDTG